MNGCFPQVITEALRLTLTAGNVGQLLTIKLSPAPDSGNRARASAKYNIEMLLPWLTGPFATGVTLVDTRGYALAWTFAKLGAWMVKGLAGDGFAVAIEIQGAQTMPARWTVARINSSLSKVQAMSAPVMQAAAAAKVASVSTWASSARKTSVMDAAARMVEAAALLLLVQVWQGRVMYPGEIAGMGDAPLLALGVGVSSQIEAAGDVDYWRVLPDTRGPFNMTFGANSSVNVAGPLRVEVLDSSGVVVISYDDYLERVVTFAPEFDGEFFIAVSGLTGYGQRLGGYSVLIELQGGGTV